MIAIKRKKMKVTINKVLAVAAVLLCAIAGVLFGVFGFGALNIVCSEIVLLPSLVLLMGVDIVNERVSVLVKTIASVVLPVALIANVLMGVFDAGTAAYIIVDGILLVGLFVGTYSMTRLNQ